jgi:hypothetical protein
MHGWQALPLFALFAACLGVRQGRLAAPVAPKSALRPRAHPTLSSAAPPPPPPDDAAPSESGNELSGQLSDELRRREQTAEEPGLDAFNSGLYAHLRRRPEFADRELYNELSNRVDVSENVFNSWREQVNATTRLEPRAGQTPGEVIELVLRALQDCDYPHEGHGIDVLQRFSSEACIASPNKISSEQLSRRARASVRARDAGPAGVARLCARAAARGPREPRAHGSR